MAQQQLIDYIKQQTQLGVDKEQIKSNLLANGWLIQDIEGGFNSIASVVTEQPPNSPVKTPGNAWKIAVISLIGILLVGGGIYAFQRFSTSQDGVTSDMDDKEVAPLEQEQEQEPQLTLEITTPKDVYKVGEEFTGGKSLLSYAGEPFKAIVLYGKSKKGLANKPTYDTSAGEIMPGDSDTNSMHRHSLRAFRMDKTGFGLVGDSFKEAGEYVFTMAVYKCSDLGLEDEDCGTQTPERVVLRSEPVAFVTKTIRVIDETTEEGVVLPGTKEQETGGTVLDCMGNEDPQCILKFLDLFTINLKSCKASKGTTPIGWEAAMGLLRGYEILGVQGDLCVIDFWFLETEGTPESLLGEQMTCKYKDFERTIEKVAGLDSCTGPLLGEIKKVFE